MLHSMCFHQELNRLDRVNLSFSSWLPHYQHKLKKKNPKANICFTSHIRKGDENKAVVGGEEEECVVL